MNISFSKVEEKSAKKRDKKRIYNSIRKMEERLHENRKKKKVKMSEGYSAGFFFRYLCNTVFIYINKFINVLHLYKNNKSIYYTFDLISVTKKYIKDIGSINKPSIKF